MSRTRIVPLGLVAVLTLGMAACTPQEPDVTEEEQLGAEQRPEEEAPEGENGGAENGGGGGETHTFVAEDIAWAEVPEGLPAGEVTLEIDNQGGILHNLVVEELGDELVAEAEGGATDEGTVALEPGEYTFYCDVAGHREAGMEAVVPVT